MKKIKFTHLFSSKKRAVSDIIVTLLLIAITIVGGVFAFSIFNPAGVTQTVNPTFEQHDVNNRSVKIIGFDTRDGNNLGKLGLSGNGIANTFDGKLVGEEYIIIRVLNPNANTVYIDKVNVNEILHEIDIDTDNTIAADSVEIGKFKLVQPNNLKILEPPGLVLDGTEAIIVIKLDTTVPDILLTSTMRILIGSPNFDAQEFLIPAGSTR